MKNNSYLYGEGVDVPMISHEVIEARLDLLKANLEKLLDHSYHTRDGVRCSAVIKAIDFWESINKKEI